MSLATDLSAVLQAVLASSIVHSLSNPGAEGVAGRRHTAASLDIANGNSLDHPLF